MTSASEWIADQTRDNRPLQWIVGDDTGTSSEAIWAHMLGLDGPRWGWSYPSDGGDLGRCIRLLRLMPEWAERLPEMADRSKRWAALVAEWPRLRELYEAWEAAVQSGGRALVDDAAERLHVAMQEILHPEGGLWTDPRNRTAAQRRSSPSGGLKMEMPGESVSTPAMYGTDTNASRTGEEIGR